jgi:hypothetical protein
MSLTPGFSPVRAGPVRQSRFNGLARRKRFKPFSFFLRFGTRLKPGVNDKHNQAARNRDVPASAQIVKSRFTSGGFGVSLGRQYRFYA